MARLRNVLVRLVFAPDIGPTPRYCTSYWQSKGVVDDALALTRNDASFSLVQDALGSTVAIHDASAHVMTEYTYGPFGAVTATAPAFPNTAQENELDSGRTSTKIRPNMAEIHYQSPRPPRSAL